MVPCKGADEVLSILNFSYCSHTKLGAMPSRQCSPAFIISTLRIISVNSTEREPTKTAETGPRYNRLTYKNNRNWGTTWKPTTLKIHGGWVGGEGQAVVEGNKNNWTLKCNVTWRPPAHSNSYSQPCLKKNVFCFFRPSASRKPHL